MREILKSQYPAVSLKFSCGVCSCRRDETKEMWPTMSFLIRGKTSTTLNGCLPCSVTLDAKSTPTRSVSTSGVVQTSSCVVSILGRIWFSQKILSMRLKTTWNFGWRLKNSIAVGTSRTVGDTSLKALRVMERQLLPEPFFRRMISLHSVSISQIINWTTRISNKLLRTPVIRRLLFSSWKT